MSRKLPATGDSDLAPFVLGFLGVLALGMICRKTREKREYDLSADGPAQDRAALRRDVHRVEGDMKRALSKSGYVTR